MIHENVIAVWCEWKLHWRDKPWVTNSPFSPVRTPDAESAFQRAAAHQTACACWCVAAAVASSQRRFKHSRGVVQHCCGGWVVHLFCTTFCIATVKCASCLIVVILQTCYWRPWSRRTEPRYHRSILRTFKRLFSDMRGSRYLKWFSMVQWNSAPHQITAWC